jgi:LysM repeat protein
MNRTGLAASLLVALFTLAACVTGGDDEEAPTSTPDEVMVIVTLTPVPSATVRSEIITYTVEEGDTLLGIAIQFGVAPEDIVAANNLANQDAIFVGQNLSIPAPSEATPDD